MRLSNKAYDIIKWVSLLAVPVVTFISALTEIWGFPYGSAIAATVSAVGVLAGAIIKISTDNYNKGDNDDGNSK